MEESQIVLMLVRKLLLDEPDVTDLELPAKLRLVAVALGGYSSDLGLIFRRQCWGQATTSLFSQALPVIIRLLQVQSYVTASHR